jgi:hypothetical protein
LLRRAGRAGAYQPGNMDASSATGFAASVSIPACSTRIRCAGPRPRFAADVVGDPAKQRTTVRVVPPREPPYSRRRSRSRWVRSAPSPSGRSPKPSRTCCTSARTPAFSAPRAAYSFASTALLWVAWCWESRPVRDLAAARPLDQPEPEKGGLVAAGIDHVANRNHGQRRARAIAGCGEADRADPGTISPHVRHSSRRPRRHRPRWRSPELAAGYWGSLAATVASGPQGAIYTRDLSRRAKRDPVAIPRNASGPRQRAPEVVCAFGWRGLDGDAPTLAYFSVSLAMNLARSPGLGC